MKLSIPAVLAVVTAASAAESLASLTADLHRAESVREIKNLQKTYAQLAAHGLWNNMSALFAEDGVLVWGQGKPGADILAAADAISSTGPAAIAAFLKSDAGKMDGIEPGSLHALIHEMPVITLSADGQTAKGRWHSQRFLGDGLGKTKIQGGLMENEYVLTGNTWKIKLIRYYPLYDGDYKKGWNNVGNNSLPIVPYHYTPDEAGDPITQASTSADTKPLTLEELQYRITRLNDEDEVRNLQHTAGYYVDRRMWPDVIDLFTVDGTVSVDGRATAPGPAGIQTALDRMGPEGLTTGILNDHPIYHMIVSISPDGKEATSRGLEIGMIGDSNQKTSEWRFCEFRHRYAKDNTTGIWKIKELAYTRLMVASYAEGWSQGGLLPRNNTTRKIPAYLDILGRLANATQKPANWTSPSSSSSNPTTLLPDLRRRLSRSTAFDSTENISAAYGYYIDDILCDAIGALHATKGFKESPGVGWYQTPARISQACSARYGDRNLTTLRANVPLHWRIQPVIIVSHDGRSANTRIRNLQIMTTRDTGSTPGGFNGGMYHDQFVLEGGRRKIWCLTIDEFYWTSASWKGGWAGVNSSTAVARRGGGIKEKRQGINGFVPDVAVSDPKLDPREVGFNGGPAAVVAWPRILRMWWSFRNPVSGRVPEAYWTGCVPCKARPEWYLEANGWEEPPTGPGNGTAAVVRVR
ncbi:hypothetical protein QBC47DRAFT_308167 [Echria macrotheca]|uniref:SnoaL-like domain-containing protein n=1 Tax=Echria macrotheca TaxID=438768 RepID=A0AAJ0F2M9_9PEZI|nr:hypothetical protein QBC47DRAFT_308167 [Echria macrotheca]